MSQKIILPNNLQNQAGEPIVRVGSTRVQGWLMGLYIDEHLENKFNKLKEEKGFKYALKYFKYSHFVYRL
jgi:hypothetical protein